MAKYLGSDNFVIDIGKLHQTGCEFLSPTVMHCLATIPSALVVALALAPGFLWAATLVAL
jgi:hypothetical protein